MPETNAALLNDTFNSGESIVRMKSDSTRKTSIEGDVQEVSGSSKKMNEAPKSFVSVLNKTPTKKVVKIVPLTIWASSDGHQG
ncbi:hypothetical protein Tco_1426328, partial [Tanacetum coccineum]